MEEIDTTERLMIGKVELGLIYSADGSWFAEITPPQDRVDAAGELIIGPEIQADQYGLIFNDDQPEGVAFEDRAAALAGLLEAIKRNEAYIG